MNDYFAKQIVHQLAELGIRRVFIAPGSRSTPLAYHFAQDERIEKVVHFDERGLGYNAYGFAKGSKTPVVIVVTSGTAVANLFPSVIEAFYEEVPLIILTADRPVELRDCGASQTIDQVKFFGTHVKWYFEVPCADPAMPAGFIGTTIGQAVGKAMESPRGPVHLNCLFREPFFSNQEIETTAPVHFEPSQRTLTSSSIEQWGKKLSSCERGVIVAGTLHSSRSLKPIFALAEQLDWPILPDITSNLRSEGHHSHVIPYYDMVLRIAPHFKPDCILHLGDRLVSKTQLQWIGKSAAPLHAVVADHLQRSDTTHTMTHHIPIDPTLFCEQLLPFVPRRVSWLQHWTALSEVIEGHLDELIPSTSEPGLIRFLHHHLPPHYSLFFANSMPAHDANQLFFPRFHRAPIYCKRGTIGIDGNLAAIAGIAEGTKRPILAVVGDQTALHDLNSLSLLQKSKVPVILVIVNNQGGGIFSFLPIAEKKDVFEQCWGAPHAWNFQEAAKMFHLPYVSLTDASLLTKYLREEKTMVIELHTHRQENFLLHKAIEEKMKEKIHSLAYANV
jgi:2-succinyl-5-enolpyruvyl-6-hydroxy-3-cyclohexene-1-carboxylate synthase